MSSSSSLLFSSAPADAINDMVKSLNPKYFIFLHYSPNRMSANSDDAKYRNGVNHLYAIFQECAWVIRRFGYIYTGEKDRTASGRKEIDLIINANLLMEIEKTVKELRTYMNHNISAQGGQQICIDFCEKWFSDHCGDTKPRTPEHYQNLNNELERYAKVVEKSCYDFIDKVSKSPNQQAILERWGNEIVKRYQRSHDIVLQSIATYYYYNSSYPQKMNSTDECRARAKRIIIDHYNSMNQYVCDLKSKIANPKVLQELTDAHSKYTDDLLYSMNNQVGLDTSMMSSTADLLALVSFDIEKVIRYFFEQELPLLINAALNRNCNCTFDIYDLIEEIMKNHKEKIIVNNNEITVSSFPLL